jgi:hypothetical protein
MVPAKVLGMLKACFTFFGCTHVARECMLPKVEGLAEEDAGKKIRPLCIQKKKASQSKAFCSKLASKPEPVCHHPRRARNLRWEKGEIRSLFSSEL